MVVRRRRLIKSLMLASMCLVSVQGAAKDDGITIDCVAQDNPILRTSTDELMAWLSEYSDAWDPKDSYSVAAPGAMGRVFSGSGRLIPPAELAAMISNSPSFVGKKKKNIWLGASDSEHGGDRSYASHLAKLLNAKVQGCPADAYFMANGAIMCGKEPVFVNPGPSGVGRGMPAGFSLGGAGFLMLFCEKESETAVNPKKMLTSSVAYGLFDDEMEILKNAADSDPKAAFRLYKYYWLSKREPLEAMQWLEKAAVLGLDVAKFNLAYELFVDGGEANRAKAEKLTAELVAKGLTGPDMR